MADRKEKAVKALWDAASELLEDPEANLDDAHRDSLLAAVELVQEAFPELAGANPRRGPGKFSSDLDEVLYAITLDGGSDEDLGDSETFNHYDLLVDLSADEVEERAEESGVTLSDEELEDIDGASAIIEENSQGFVSVKLFDTGEAARKAWAKIEKEWEKFSEEVES